VSRSQIFSFDFISSIVMFLIFFLIFFLVYSQLKAETAGAEASRNAENTAALLSDQLIGTAGVPTNWTNGTVVTIGLAPEEGVLSYLKVGQLNNLSYPGSKSFLALNQFEYFLNISTIGGVQRFSYGQYPPANSTSVVPIRRMVLYDNGSARELATFQVVVWR
jgi:hypothetical protein